MENLLFLILAFLTAMLLSQIIVPKILVISLRKRLFDTPDERKIHKRPIPRLGGVTCFPGILVTLFLFTAIRIKAEFLPNDLFDENIATEFLFMIASLTLLYIVGIGDDLVGVRYHKKLVIQLVSASLLPVSGLYINNFYGLFGIHALPIYVAVPLTVLVVVFITNAMNLIDGIDGLASGLSMVAFLILGVIFINMGLWIYAMLAFISMGVIIPFFRYNVFGNADRGKKIFMGDTGSLTLGYLLSFLILRYVMNSPYNSQSLIYGPPLLIGLSILLVPGFDVIRVVFRRIRNGRSPFHPDRTHIHHKFLDMGFSPRSALICIQCISVLFFVFTTLAVRIMNVTLVLSIDIALWIAMHLWFDHRIRAVQRKRK